MPRHITTVAIGGMRTAHCTRAVFTALAGVPGISRADVTLGRAEVVHDGSATLPLLRDAVALAGYELLDATEELRRALPIL